MSIPSPCYFLAQAETVSSQTTSLHWTITRFPISQLMNKRLGKKPWPTSQCSCQHLSAVVDWVRVSHSKSDLINCAGVGRRTLFDLVEFFPTPNSLSGFQAHEKMVHRTIFLIHIQIVVDFPLRNVGCVACPFDFLSFQEISIDMIT